MIDQSGLPQSLLVQADSIEWSNPDDLEGTSLKCLWRAPDDSRFVALVRMQPRKGQTHLHEGAVEAYTFEGKWGYAEHDWIAGPGSFIYEPPGSIHTQIVEEPMLALFHVEGRIIHFDDVGNAVEDPSIGTLSEILADRRPQPA